jgi:hypothetical protein
MMVFVAIVPDSAIGARKCLWNPARSAATQSLPSTASVVIVLLRLWKA